MITGLAHLILNGPHRGGWFPITCGPVLQLPHNPDEPVLQLLDNPSGNLLEASQFITYTLRTLAVTDGSTQKIRYFWVTKDTKESAATIVDLLVDLARGEK
jgi:hypothetical protein